MGTRGNASGAHLRGRDRTVTRTAVMLARASPDTAKHQQRGAVSRGLAANSLSAYEERCRTDLLKDLLVKIFACRDIHRENITIINTEAFSGEVVTRPVWSRPIPLLSIQPMRWPYFTKWFPHR
jgi:hypothetical protein